jgi:hypothetical protein
MSFLLCSGGEDGIAGVNGRVDLEVDSIGRCLANPMEILAFTIVHVSSLTPVVSYGITFVYL